MEIGETIAVHGRYEVSFVPPVGVVNLEVLRSKFQPADGPEQYELKLLDQRIPPQLAETMLLEWWKISIQPKVDFPDLKNLFSGLGEE